MIRIRLLVLLVLVASCSKRAERTDSDSTTADMPGMAGAGDSTLPDITFSAAQVRHGGVQWASVESGASASSASLPGRLVPNEDHTARLGALVGGRVLSVRVQPGDRVSSGQTLLTLLSPDAAMALSELTRTQAEVVSRQSAATLAHSARERAERLLALKAIPRQDYDRAVAEDEQAAAASSQASAELQRARATAEQMGIGLTSGEMQVRSPLSGVVLERLAVPGTVVEAGAPLVVVTDPSSLWLRIEAPENQAGGYRRGERLAFTVPAFPTDTFTARIDGIGAGLDATTRTLSIRATVINTARRLRPEMLASVVATTTLRPMPMVPDEAVVTIKGKTVVFAVMTMPGDSTMFTPRVVRTGPRSGGQVTILAGLTKGETVVTRGAFAIKAQIEKGSMPAMEM